MEWMEAGRKQHDIQERAGAAVGADAVRARRRAGGGRGTRPRRDRNDRDGYTPSGGLRA